MFLDCGKKPDYQEKTHTETPWFRIEPITFCGLFASGFGLGIQKICHYRCKSLKKLRYSPLNIPWNHTAEIQQKTEIWHMMSRLCDEQMWEMILSARLKSWLNLLLKYSSFCASLNPYISVTMSKISAGNLLAAAGREVIHSLAVPWISLIQILNLILSRKQNWKLNQWLGLPSPRPSQEWISSQKMIFKCLQLPSSRPFYRVFFGQIQWLLGRSPAFPRQETWHPPPNSGGDRRTGYPEEPCWLLGVTNCPALLEVPHFEGL